MNDKQKIKYLDSLTVYPVKMYTYNPYLLMYILVYLFFSKQRNILKQLFDVYKKK